MTISFTNVIAKIASIDLFKTNSSTGNFETGLFIGRPFHLDYEKACILVADAWKLKAKGIPQGSFLLAYYENEPNVHEALLLRVLKPTTLPTDNNVISSMIEYYKDNLKTSGKESQLDTYTRYEFSFSGLECRVLGTFYKDDTGCTRFGADVENFYSSHNYRVIKPNADVLELLVNFREEGIINDKDLKNFLSECNLPKLAEDVDFDECNCISHKPVAKNPIRNVVAIDGGYTEVSVQTGFPSSMVAFFQIGALIFSIDDLEGLDRQPFIDPDDMTKLKQIQRLKFTLPIRNVQVKTEGTLVNSVRRTIYNFFCQKIDKDDLITTLRWFIFQEYDTPIPVWNLSNCPVCGTTNIPLHRDKMSHQHTFNCHSCGAELFLTDVFRLHEAIDEELGAGGILGYLISTVEQIVLIHLFKVILKLKPELLNEMLFIKDGPLAFFGQTANMYKPMCNLVAYLFKNHNLYLAGLEKSGAFVEHADEISEKLKDGTVLILNNNYIYKFILPGKPDLSRPYGATTYYSNKIIFKTNSSGMYVVSLPNSNVLANPKESDFRNLGVILSNIEKLKCDMYDSALIPVALANKLVSLADHPSSGILQKFAKGAIYNS